MKSRLLAAKVNLICSIETAEALWHIIKTQPFKANVLMLHPHYDIFSITKKNGTARTIEDPSDELKVVQDRLNDFLQPLYFFNRTDAAYGYIMKPGDVNETRNILTNAQKHSRSKYLLNIDVKDFFHYVKWQAIYNALISVPFRIHDKVAESICNLCTLDGRLPMGAPTSPALSNIATYSFDKEMELYCKGEHITYTRYVDDMSFSANETITMRHFEQLSGIITKQGYVINPEKIKWFSGAETKVITGLIVANGTVSVPQEYLVEIEKEIGNFKVYVLMQTRLYPKRNIDFISTKPAQKIRGALAFVESVHGREYRNLLILHEQLENAARPPLEYESRSWLEIGYSVW